MKKHAASHLAWLKLLADSLSSADEEWWWYKLFGIHGFNVKAASMLFTLTEFLSVLREGVRIATATVDS